MKIKLSILISIFVFAGFYFLNPDNSEANQRSLNLFKKRMSSIKRLNKLIAKRKNLKSLVLDGNNFKNFKGLKLPEGLEALSVSANPVETYEGLNLPKSLIDLYIGKYWRDKRQYEVLGDLSTLNINSNLEILSIDNMDSLDWSTLSYPANLKTLRVSETDVTDLSVMNLPANLRRLDLWYLLMDENQDWSLISNLETLTLVSRVEDFSKVVFPPKLKHLEVRTYSPPLFDLDMDIDQLNLPDTLEYLDVSVDLPFNGSNFPNSLKYLHLNTDVLFEDIDNEIFLPENLEVLRMEGSWDVRSRFRGAVREMLLPDSLKRLDIHSMDISTIRELRNIPANLVELDLIDNNLATLDDLLGRDLPQSLRRLVLILNPISKAEKRRIRRYYKKTNPDLVIFFENEPRRKNRIPLKPEALNWR